MCTHASSRGSIGIVPNLVICHQFDLGALFFSLVVALLRDQKEVWAELGIYPLADGQIPRIQICLLTGSCNDIMGRRCHDYTAFCLSVLRARLLYPVSTVFFFLSMLSHSAEVNSGTGNTEYIV